MGHPISPNDLQQLRRQADVVARRLRRGLQLPWGDLDDLNQDLLTDLLRRLRAFDRQRGSLDAFAAAVMANRASTIARQVGRHRRMFGVAPVSLDDLVPNADGLTVGDQIPEEKSLAAVQGHWVDPILQLERRLDLECALARLDGKSRSLASALLKGSAHLLARAGLGSRSALYRQTRDLRLALMAAGITAG